MLNTYSIASHPIAHTKQPLTAKNSQEKFSFNAFGLSNENIIVQNFDGLHSAGQSNFGNSANNWQDGSQFLFRYWQSKTLTLRGVVRAKTSEELEQKIDEIKKNCLQKEGTLRYKTAKWSYREITATCTVCDFMREGYHITFCPFVMTFVASDVYFRDGKTFLAEQAITGNVAFDYFINGSAPSFPQIYFIINNGSLKKISISSNGMIFSISANLQKGDIIEIDTKNKRVRKNGKYIDYDGPCPILNIWSNSLVYEFLSDENYSLDLFISYPHNFL